MWPFKKIEKTVSELKPCPWCGETWYVSIIEPEEGENYWAVGCFAQMEGGCGFSGEFTSREYAVKAWNNRS